MIQFLRREYLLKLIYRKERILILYYHLQEKEKKINLMDESQ